MFSAFDSVHRCHTHLRKVARRVRAPKATRRTPGCEVRGRSVLSLFLCLSFSVLLSLSSFSVSLCLSLSPCDVVCCVVWCVSLWSWCCWWSWCCCWSWCVFCVWLQKRLRMYIQNVPVYAGTARTCVETCVCGAGTHGDVLNVHTGPVESTHGVQEIIVSSACQNLPTYCCLVLQRFTKETFGSFLFSNVRID